MGRSLLTSAGIAARVLVPARCRCRMVAVMRALRPTVGCHVVPFRHRTHQALPTHGDSRRAVRAAICRTRAVGRARGLGHVRGHSGSMDCGGFLKPGAALPLMPLRRLRLGPVPGARNRRGRGMPARSAPLYLGRIRRCRDASVAAHPDGGPGDDWLTVRVAGGNSRMRLPVDAGSRDRIERA